MAGIELKLETLTPLGRLLQHLHIIRIAKRQAPNSTIDENIQFENMLHNEGQVYYQKRFSNISILIRLNRLRERFWGGV